MATAATTMLRTPARGVGKAKRPSKPPEPLYLRECWAARPEPTTGELKAAARRTGACLKGLKRELRSFRKWDAAVREVLGTAGRSGRPRRILERTTAVATRAA